IEKQLRFFSVVDPAVPAAILGDAVRLRQILMNLVGNAIKFTAQGEVSLAVTSSSSEDSRHFLEFIVRDTGPGIAAQDQEQIFEPFSQADSSLSRKHRGTGLGLAISMALARQMGGSLWVESAAGKGSAFHFSLVAQALSHTISGAYQQDRSDTLPRLNMPGLRVLVADDNRVNIRVTLAILQRLGCSALGVGSGIEVMER